MYRAILQVIRTARVRSGSHALAAVALGARTFGDVVHDTGLSRSAAAAALHALVDLGLLTHDGTAYELRREGFPELSTFDEADSDAPSSKFEPPCNVVANMAIGSNFELDLGPGLQQQPVSASRIELTPELAAIADEIRHYCPGFNPRPESSIEGWVLHWQDRAHRMRQQLAHFRDPENYRKVHNPSAWLRSGVESNWAPIRQLAPADRAYPDTRANPTPQRYQASH